jgi:plastocyanin
MPTRRAARDGSDSSTRTLLLAALAGALAAFALVRHAGASPVDWSRAQPLEVRMIEYEFIPNELRLRHGVPYRLHLVNAGKEGHDFTAPDFFAAIRLENPDALNNGGKSVFLHPGESADINFVAPITALFALRCADHDWAGMTATIVVE